MFANGFRLSHKRILQVLKKIEGFDKKTFIRLAAETSLSTAVEVLFQFRKTLYQAKLDLQTASAARNNEMVCKICHKLRGSSELLGFMGFSQSLAATHSQMKKSPISVEDFDIAVGNLLLLCDSLAVYLDNNCLNDVRFSEP